MTRKMTRARALTLVGILVGGAIIIQFIPDVRVRCVVFGICFMIFCYG
jgi:hypothetical protein